MDVTCSDRIKTCFFSMSNRARVFPGFKGKWPRPRPGSAERPNYHAPDPLLPNTKAVNPLISNVKPVETALPDDLTFIHRPPPTSPSPFSLTSDPVSPLLQPRKPRTDDPLPPFIRPSHGVEPTHKRITGATLAEIRKLRTANPDVWTRGALAKKFGTSQNFIGLVAALKKSKRKKANAKEEARHQAIRDNWTDRRAMVRDIREKRKEFW